MKLRFLVGLAAGYVLGARDGRERYEQIVQTARGLLGDSGDPASGQRSTAEPITGLATTPVIVGPGPEGMATPDPQAVVLPDLEPSSAPADPSAGQRAKRLSPPADA